MCGFPCRYYMKNKSLYKIDCIQRFHNYLGKTLTKWKLIKRFISFLRNPYELEIKITKINNVIISQNQTWEYNEKTHDFELHTDLSTAETHDLYKKDKFIE